MANPRRYAFQFRSSPVPAVTDLFAKIDVDGGALPVLDALHSVGVAAVSKIGVGEYFFTLDNKYPRLLGVQYTPVVGAGVAAAPDMQVVFDAVSSLGQFTLKFSLNGVAVDPAATETLLFQITLKNSTVPVG